MSRIKKDRVFGKRTAPSQSIEPAKVFVISAEGKAEESYFKAFNEYVLELGLKRRIVVDVLEKEDTMSAPKHVVGLLDEYLKTLDRTVIDYGIDNEELWIIIDRDRQNTSKEQLLEILSKCKEKGYNMGITNPLFEFWLLLHVANPADYNSQVLLENKKDTTKGKRFVEKELKRLMNGYKKENLQFNRFKPFIETAIKRAELLETIPESIINQLGTSVHLLVTKIIEKKD